MVVQDIAKGLVCFFILTSSSLAGLNALKKKGPGMARIYTRHPSSFPLDIGVQIIKRHGLIPLGKATLPLSSITPSHGIGDKKQMDKTASRAKTLQGKKESIRSFNKSYLKRKVSRAAYETHFEKILESSESIKVVQNQNTGQYMTISGSGRIAALYMAFSPEEIRTTHIPVEIYKSRGSFAGSWLRRRLERNQKHYPSQYGQRQEQRRVGEVALSMKTTTPCFPSLTPRVHFISDN